MTTANFLDDFDSAIAEGSDIPEGEYIIQPIEVECKTSKKSVAAGYEHYDQLVITLAILGDIEGTPQGQALRGRTFNIYPTDGSREGNKQGNARFFGTIVSLGVGPEWYTANRDALSKMSKNEVMEAIAAALVGEKLTPRAARIVKDGNFYKPQRIQSLPKDIDPPTPIPVRTGNDKPKAKQRPAAPVLPVPTFGDHDEDAPVMAF